MAPDTKPTILLIEDSQQLRWTISMHFRALGWRVLRARSAAPALAVIARRKVDAVVIDKDLPCDGGADPLPALKRAGIPVVAVEGPAPELDALESRLRRLIGAND